MVYMLVILLVPTTVDDKYIKKYVTKIVNPNLSLVFGKLKK